MTTSQRANLGKAIAAAEEHGSALAALAVSGVTIDFDAHRDALARLLARTEGDPVRAMAECLALGLLASWDD